MLVASRSPKQDAGQWPQLICRYPCTDGTLPRRHEGQEAQHCRGGRHGSCRAGDLRVDTPRTGRPQADRRRLPRDQFLVARFSQSDWIGASTKPQPWGAAQAASSNSPVVGATLVVAAFVVSDNGGDHKGRPYIVLLSARVHCYRFHDGPITSDWLKRATNIQGGSAVLWSCLTCSTCKQDQSLKSTVRQ